MEKKLLALSLFFQSSFLSAMDHLSNENNTFKQLRVKDIPEIQKNHNKSYSLKDQQIEPLYSKRHTKEWYLGNHRTMAVSKNLPMTDALLLRWYICCAVEALITKEKSIEMIINELPLPLEEKKKLVEQKMDDIFRIVTRAHYIVENNLQFFGDGKPIKHTMIFEDEEKNEKYIVIKKGEIGIIALD